MTREQIKKQFPDATEEQITAILDINGSEISDLKNKIPNKSEYSELIRKAGEYDKLAEQDLTDAEKVQKAIKEANDSKNEYKKKSNRLEAEKILVGAGLLSEDYDGLLEGIVTDDEEQTKTLATNLANMVKKQKESVEKSYKEKLMDETITSGSAGSATVDEESEAEKFAKNLVAEKSKDKTDSESILENYK